MLLVANAVFLYYTTWTFVLPFLDESNPLQAFFLPREWAIRIPVLLVLAAFAGVGTFVGKVLKKAAEKERLKKAANKAK